MNGGRGGYCLHLPRTCDEDAPAGGAGNGRRAKDREVREGKTALARAGRLVRTVRYLKPRQVADRVIRRLGRDRAPSGPVPPLRPARVTFLACEGRPCSMTGPASFRFLAREAGIVARADWEKEGLSRLWLYNLHYFDDLLADGAAERRSWHVALVRRWVAENPPAAGTGWEPYPLSRRLVNWIGWSLAGTPLPDEALPSLADQARVLIRRLEFHLLGNHLFANAKALVFAGSFFSGAEAEAWLKTGLNLIGAEIGEQILPDGGHFELSPMYHALILEDMLDLVQLAGIFPDALRGPAAEQRWRERAGDMLAWLARMTHPDGEIALFNDSAFGQARPPERLAAYARRLGIEAAPPAGGLERLAASGYIRLQKGPWCAFFDAAEVGASYIPGHAHADTLSFELSVGGRRLVTNGGTSVYAPGPERERERGTASHATVEIDGENSSEVWASFRVGRRARPRGVETRENGPEIVAAASHDGYRFLRGRPGHRREIAVGAAKVTIRDSIEGRSRHYVTARFPLHPGVSGLRRTERGWRVDMPEGTVTIGIDGPADLAVEDGAFAPAFGVRQQRPVLVWRYEGELPCAVTTVFAFAPR